jgi:fructose 1,6-bisphosphatase
MPNSKIYRKQGGDEMVVESGATMDMQSGATVKLLDSTALAATTAEINRTCDVSTRMIAAGATLTLTEAAHDGKIIALDTAAGSIVTLPTSSGGGAVYKFLVTVTATSNSHVIKVGNATDEMGGFVVQDSDTATAPNIWWAADNDDTITLNRTTSGLAAQGEYFEIVDALAAHYMVRGFSQASGTEVTPFSATV